MTFTLNAEVAAVLAAAPERSGPPSGPVHDVLAELKEQGVIAFTGLAGTPAYELGAGRWRCRPAP